MACSFRYRGLARSFGTALVHAYPEQFSLPEELNARRNVPALLEAIGLAPRAVLLSAKCNLPVLSVLDEFVDDVWVCEG